MTRRNETDKYEHSTLLAVHKPGGISSADVLRDLQRHFNPSDFFKPWLDAERQRRRQESRYQQRRRRDKHLQVKLGHGGTLDPIATGVLITGVGKGTKHLNNFLACTKTYEAVVLFGVATDTYDRVGKVVTRAPYEHVTKEKVEEALEKFRGKIMQRPSIFSALKVQGKKLYEYAREGIEPPIEIVERPVEVTSLEIMEWYEPGTHEWKWPTHEAGSTEKGVAQEFISREKEFIGRDRKRGRVQEEKNLKRKTPPPQVPESITQENTEVADEPEPASKRIKAESPEPQSTDLPQQPEPTAADEEPTPEVKPEPELSPSPPPPAVKLTMTVSSGFYVRSLAHDLGLALNSNAIMTSLVRTRQGDFELSPDRILEYKDLEAGEEVWGPKVQRFLDEWCEKNGQDNRPQGHESGNDS